MLTSVQCAQRYGLPEKESWMVLWRVPAELQIGAIPARIYCNRDLIVPLDRAFAAIREAGIGDLIRTWDGCFQIRAKRTGQSLSLHSWGVAVDLNASWNPLGKPPTMDPRLVSCFTDSGFDWGGTWQRPDGMHFQLRAFPR